MLLWISVYRYLFKSLSFLLGTYPEGELLDRVLTLGLTFWGTGTLFSLVAAPCYLLASKAQAFQYLHILTNTYDFFFLTVAILIGMKYYFIAVYMYISLMISY